MSLQQNNPNIFPKHIQHTRLQKEEDEEQWISGEELCTDGSSDEESNLSDIKKKCKSRTIYFPSKDLSPVKKNVSRASNTSPEQNDKDLDCAGNSQNSNPNPTQWRPKRGSIKLPNIDENPLDIEMEKWNTETQYKKTFEKLTAFKNDIVNNNVKEVKSLDDDGVGDILFYDREIEKFYKVYEECKQDRMNLQREVCREIKTLNKSSKEHKNTKKFLELFKFQMIEDNSANENTTKPKKSVQNLKSISKKDIQLPVKSTHKMAVSLSVEEKSRLNFLLSDIEINEIDSMENQNDVLDFNLEETKTENAFQSTEKELQDLENIEHKLETLQENCENANLKGKLSEDLDSMDEENREWKAYLKDNDDKIRKIDKKLVKLKECNSTDETTECVE